MNALKALAVAAMLACGYWAGAADPGSIAAKPMKMDDPMPDSTKMKKKGMKKGDVKRAAEAKQREMKPKLEKESAGGANVLKPIR